MLYKHFTSAAMYLIEFLRIQSFVVRLSKCKRKSRVVIKLTTAMVILKVGFAFVVSQQTSFSCAAMNTHQSISYNHPSPPKPDNVPSRKTSLKNLNLFLKTHH